MNGAPKRDWEKTRIHFVCGFLVGLFAAYSGSGWLITLTVALGFGILAAIFLDKFWDNIRSWW
jgi:ABC-type phosphate transport system permease subunit